MERSSWPIIVGGCHRSGTSLVRRILNAHSRVFCGPEVKFFRDLHGDYLGDPLRHARFFPTAEALCPAGELLEIFGPAYIALLRRAADRADKPRWADKNPENVLYLGDWQRLLGDAWLFLQVVRHPLDTLASIKEARFPLTIPAALAERIAFYRRYTESGLEFGKAHPDRYFRVRYEELVRAPRDTISQLMAWTGEAFEPGQLDYNSFPQQPGLEDPKVGRTQRVHGDSVGRWRGDLPFTETRTIWREARDLWAAIDPKGQEETDRELRRRDREPATGLLSRAWRLVGEMARFRRPVGRS